MEEQINKNKNEKIEIDHQKSSEDLVNRQPVKKSKDSLATFIILGVGLLIILTILVLIGSKLQNSKNSLTEKDIQNQDKTVIKIEETESPTSKPLTKEEIIKQAFYYPNTISEQADDDFDLVLYTNDSVTTAYKYYEELVDLNNWELGPSGMATDKSGGFLYIAQADFRADLNVTNEVNNKYGSTKIEIRIDPKEEIAITSTFNRPSVEPTPPMDTELSQAPDEEGFILPFSNSRSITREDLTGLTEWQLKIARNEIYARHGREFVHQDLSCYFDKLPWYKIDPEYSENKLSPLEISNATFILNYEKEINSSLIDKDTGCK